MKTATASCRLDALYITVHLTGSAADLAADAQRGLNAALSYLSSKDYRAIGNITVRRAEYAAALEGESELEPEDTQYGQLIARATEIATYAATAGWANPDDASVIVDIAAAEG